MSKLEKNTYGVEKRKWNRWSEHARGVFNKLYTVRWNAAWMAADLTQEHAHFAAMTGIRALGAITLGLQKTKHNKRERMNIGRAIKDLGAVIKAGEINRG